MKILHRHLMLTTALALSLAVAAPFATHAAEESATVPTNPGFKASGQINPGATLQAPSQSTDIRKIPSTAEARAALLAPDDPNPVLGAPSAPPQPQANAGANAGGADADKKQADASGGGDKKNASPQAAGGGGDPTTATGGQAAVGGPMSPGASAGGANNQSASGASGSGTQQAAGETTGARPKDTRPGPFGATGQTMPSKFSERNDTLDRVPTMAWPNRLTDEERQQIYKAVMADKSQAAADADALKPASELSTDQALNGMHALPESLQGIALLKGLQFVKGKDKVLLVTPSTRTVVDEIAAS
jgi:hypothetical protein